MTEYRNQDGTTTTVVERRSNTGAIIAGIVVLILVVVGILFATGFWSADVKGGAMPTVDVSAKGGDLPAVDMKSKAVVVGTKKETVTVPVVGVKDNGNK
ncbi:hypothetical protein [Sphingomonas oligophenolica]|uniref:Uncharacterized protein n=1 Tax=Sphingomonas oligophenolica TaxID=301154 RepID=A0A502CRF6_9SPHN|nr:hypothetical protein [Sphingomonas oligophenolica]TPG14291.1 hypothetical protein EAH84_02950 [Sphingomonas oligophenolica]